MLRNGLVVIGTPQLPSKLDIVIHGNVISEVTTAARISPGDRVLDLDGHLVIPGLVNAHTHSHNAFSKGAFDGMPLEIWAQYLAARTTGRTPREIYVGAALNAMEMAKTGTTTACEMTQISPHPTPEGLDAAVQGYVDVGIRVSFAPQVFDLSVVDWMPEVAPGLPARLVRELKRSSLPLPEVMSVVRDAAIRWNGAADTRVTFGIGPSAVTRCSTGFLDECGELSRSLDLHVQTHLSETRREALAARRRFGTSPTERLQELGLLGTRTVLAHAIWLERSEMELIAESGSSVSHNPFSNLKLGAGTADLDKLRAAGCNVALGTDGSASSDSQNMFGPLRLSSVLHRPNIQEYESWPSASDAWAMATVNGARAASQDPRQSGEIRAGSFADLVVLTLDSLAFRPLNHVINQLVHAESGASVRTVIVDGKFVVENGVLVNINEASLLEEADEMVVRMRASEDLQMAQRLERLIRPTMVDR